MKRRQLPVLKPLPHGGGYTIEFEEKGCRTSTVVKSLDDVEWRLWSSPSSTNGETSSETTISETLPTPPAAAEFLLSILLKQKRAEAVLGDLEEYFQEDCEIMDLARARRRYWARALRSIGPLLWTKLKRLGVFAALLDGARRFLGG